MALQLTVIIPLGNLLLLGLASQQHLTAQHPGPALQGQQSLATVQIAAFSTSGTFLGPPSIRVFEKADTKQNLAAQFRAGLADRIPFGIYRIEGYVTGFASASRCVRVDAPRVFVVLGLPLGGIDFPIDQFKLHGHVTGSPLKSSGDVFVKLVGVYSDTSVEALVDSDGNFDLTGLSWGAYWIFAISEHEVLAGRRIDIPYEARPLELHIGRDPPF